MNTSEVLNRAADLIERRGWRQGSWGGGASTAAPVCMEGAIAAAMDLHLGPNISPGTAEENHAFSVMLECPAYAAVKAYLELQDHVDLWDFNDRKGRTQAEVIEVLRAAAAIEESREADAIIAGANSQPVAEFVR